MAPPTFELPVVFEIPTPTVSLNEVQREHYRTTRKRTKRQKEDTRASWNAHFRTWRPELPVRITLTRMAYTDGLDRDNLLASMKAVRDELADILGVDDADHRDGRVKWKYDQDRASQPRYCTVVVMIEAIKEAA